MNIGIIVAMSKELNLLLPLLENHSTHTIDGITFHRGSINNHAIVAMQCGIGKVNAAIGTYAMLTHHDIDLVINTGVAGGAGGAVDVMDIVVGAQIAYHDVYCGPESTVGAIQGLPQFFNSDTDVINKIPDAKNIHKGLICSGDQFIDTSEQIAKIMSIYPQALAVDMESAAIAHVCHVKGKRFLSLRIISDSPGASHNNTAQYENFWDAAPAQTFDVLHRLLLSI